MENATTTRGLR